MGNILKSQQQLVDVEDEEIDVLNGLDAPDQPPPPVKRDSQKDFGLPFETVKENKESPPTRHGCNKGVAASSEPETKKVPETLHMIKIRYDPTVAEKLPLFMRRSKKINDGAAILDESEIAEAMRQRMDLAEPEVVTASFQEPN